MDQNQNTAFQRAQETQDATLNKVETSGAKPSGYIAKDTTDKYKIKSGPILFGSTTEAKLTTTIEVGSLINALFKKVFKDYEGSNIVFDPTQNRWKADIFFCENANANTETAIKNLIPISANFNSGVGNRRPTVSAMVKGYNLRTANIHYDLSKETQEALSWYYMPHEVDRKKSTVDFSKRMSEQSEPSSYGYNSTTIYVCVHGLDVVKLLADIYGNKNEENHFVDYSVTAVRPLSQISQTNSNMLLSIQRIDCVVVEEICKKIGAIPTQGRLPIIR